MTGRSLEEILSDIRLDGSPSAYLSAFRQIRERELRWEGLSARHEVKIAILSSFTVQNLEAYLDIHARLSKLNPTFYIAPFNRYHQEILDGGSGLYAFGPDVVILVLDIEDVLPELLLKIARGTGGEIARDADALVADLTSLLEQFCARSQALVVVNNFAAPESPLGLLDTRAKPGLAELVGDVNHRLLEAFRLNHQVYLFDFSDFVSRVGRDRCFDPKMFSLSRMRLAYGVLPDLAERYLGYIRALRGLSRKCLVLDLDNTLWGGVIGEDGPAGIQLGADPPGNVYLTFQRHLLQLFHRGILLAINSRNNWADAMDVIAHHPDMVFKEEHFASIQINWDAKASNMKRIAEELSLPLDALVFFDDSPAERMLMRRAMPEVLTIEVPDDPSLYVEAVRSLSVFETLAITDEDRSRTHMYREEWERRALRERAETVEDYLEGLRMRLDLRLATPHTIPRIAQLTQRTNQFNMSTKRYSAAQIEELVADARALVFGLSLQDLYGDMGLIGAAIVRTGGPVAEVDTFLLSCRALGRGVEDGFLSLLARECRARGASELQGRVVKTEKNTPAREFFRRYGTAAEASGDSYEWRVNLEQDQVAAPIWFQCGVPAALGVGDGRG